MTALVLLQALMVIGGVTSSPSGTKPTFQRPYEASSNNLIYNLLFCDDPDLLRGKDAGPPVGALAVLLSPDARIDDVRRIAEDEKQESRLRVLAFNLLRSKGVKVPAPQVLASSSKSAWTEAWIPWRCLKTAA